MEGTGLTANIASIIDLAVKAARLAGGWPSARRWHLMALKQDAEKMAAAMTVLANHATEVTDRTGSEQDDLLEHIELLAIHLGGTGRFGPLPRHSLAHFQLLRATKKALATAQGILEAAQEKVTIELSKQTQTERGAQALKMRSQALRRNLTPYDLAAVHALLDQYSTVRNVEMSQRYLLLASGLIYGSPFSEGSQPPIGGQVHEIEAYRRSLLHRNLLSSLEYASMGRRRNNIAYSDASSFDWIYNESDDNCLPNWFDNGQGPFLVFGKEGSGKSTLMRFILEHQKTKLNLQMWAASGGYDLVLVSFFFWRNGTRLERSVEGLWRSLLFTLLERYPTLVPCVLPKEWAVIYSEATASSLGFWNAQDLQVAFRLIATQQQIPVKICILIDGLDEQHSDGEDETDRLKCIRFLCQDLGLLPNVKIILSSRPMAEWDQLGMHPSVILHDHTQGDVRSYVIGNLKSPNRDGGHGTALYGQVAKAKVAQGIISASDGIFLSATILTQHANNTLASTGSFPELDGQILSGKSSRDLYHILWEGLSPSTREQAAQVMAVMLASEDIYTGVRGSEGNTRLIDITLALESVERTVLKPITSWRLAEPMVERSCARIADGLRREWPGFIKISRPERGNDSGDDDSVTVSSASCLEYCHRSVPEFFMDLFNKQDQEQDQEQEQNQEQNQGHDVAPAQDVALAEVRRSPTPSPPGFRVRIAQLKSLVYQLKILPQPCPGDHLSTVWSFTSMALGVAHLVERDEHSGPVYFDLLEQVDATMAFHHQKLHWNSKDEYLPTTIRDHAGTVALADHGIDTRRKARMHWSNFHSNEECIHPRNWADSFVSLAVQFGLRDYVSHALDALMARSPLQRSLASLKSSAKVKTGRPLLMYALAPHVPLATLAPHDLVTVPVVELLLDKGLCINEKFEGRTCWQAALAWVYDMFVTKGGHPISAAGGTNRDVKAVAETRAEICLLLLKRGADVNVMVEVNDTRTLWRSLMTDSEESEKEKRHITVTVALRKSFTQWVSEGMRTRLLATIKEIEERSEAEERKKGKKVFTWKK